MKLFEAITGQDSLSRTLAESPNMQLPWIGYRIFKWLLLVAGLLLLLLVIYAWQTYPTASDIDGVVGTNASDQTRLAAMESARAAWLTSVKDLGQLFVLTPVFPLIGAVIVTSLVLVGRRQDPARLSRLLVI